jgi:hypothetical protein
MSLVQLESFASADSASDLIIEQKVLSARMTVRHGTPGPTDGLSVAEEKVIAVDFVWRNAGSTRRPPPCSVPVSAPLLSEPDRPAQDWIRSRFCSNRSVPARPRDGSRDGDGNDRL